MNYDTPLENVTLDSELSNLYDVCRANVDVLADYLAHTSKQQITGWLVSESDDNCMCAEGVLLCAFGFKPTKFSTVYHRYMERTVVYTERGDDEEQELCIRLLAMSAVDEFPTLDTDLLPDSVLGNMADELPELRKRHQDKFRGTPGYYATGILADMGSSDDRSEIMVALKHRAYPLSTLNDAGLSFKLLAEMIRYAWR